MTTFNQVDSFSKVYWNLIQTLAWIHLRKDELVKLADDNVTEWGFHKEEMTTTSGKSIVDIPNGRPTVVSVELYGVWDDAIYENVTIASEALIKELQIGNIICYGTANNEGNLQEIPVMSWADLIFYYDPNIARPSDLLRRDITEWHNLKFRITDILRYWPSLSIPINSRSLQKQTTKDRNRLLQVAMDGLVAIKKSTGETFTKASLANEIYGSDKFQNISVDSIIRNTRKTW